jgi:hypothetical protein
VTARKKANLAKARDATLRVLASFLRPPFGIGVGSKTAELLRGFQGREWPRFADRRCDMKKIKNLRFAVVVGALALAIVGALPAEAGTSQTNGLVWLDDFSKVPGAYSVLMRNEDGVAVRVHSRKLAKGAYTMWWVIFNNPEECDVAFQCGPGDFPFNGGDPAVQVSIQFATGFIVPSNNGKVRADAGLEVGEDTKNLLPQNLNNPMGAEIHMVLRTHGPVDLDNVHNQISEFHDGSAQCDDACLDLQAVIHPAP